MSSKDKLLASAQKNLEKGQLAKAIKDYQQLVALDPRDVRHRQKLAELFSRAQMQAEALNEYSAVARYYTETGFFLKAIAVCKQMQRLDPEQANIYRRLAELNIKQGLVGNAIAEYRNLVAYYEKKRLYGDAVGVLQKISELEPDNYPVKIRIAEFYVKAGLRENARTELDAILRALRQTGDSGRLLKLYEFFLPHFPDDPEIKAGFAEALIGCGEADRGLQMLQALVREHPDHGGVLAPLARGYRFKGDFENERLTYQHLLKNDSTDPGLRLAFLQACLDSGEHERALDELGEWGEALSAGEHRPEVHAAYRRLQDLLPGNERVLRGLAALGAGAEAPTGEPELPPQDAAMPEEIPEVPAGPEPVAETGGAGEALPCVPDAVPAAAATEESPPPEWAEEIPLEFLETAAEEPSVAEPAAETLVVEEPAVLESAAELELEVELDFDLGGIDSGDDLLSTAAVGFADEPSCDTPLAASAEEPTDLLPEGRADEEGEEEIIDLEDDLVEDLDEVVEFSQLVDAEPTGAATYERAVELPNPADEVVLRDLRLELEEAEFYLQQRLLDDAERVCRDILARVPESGEARDKLDAVRALRNGPVSTAATEDFFDLSSEIMADGALRATEDLAGLDEVDRFRVDGIFSEFKKGIAEQIDGEDTETHYNLGIAYKEMGLLEDAVSEFERAMQSPARLLDCLTLKGICLAELGAFDRAEEVFRTGLGRGGLSAAERTSLHYELGLLYEAWSRPREALESFSAVAATDLFFRDVGAKVGALRQQLGVEPLAGEAGAKGNKDRVSYI